LRALESATELRFLTVAGNRIRALEGSLCFLPHLVFLDVSDNLIEDINAGKCLFSFSSVFFYVSLLKISNLKAWGGKLSIFRKIIFLHHLQCVYWMDNLLFHKEDAQQCHPYEEFGFKRNPL
jgi:hypothetical protein